MAQCMSFEYYSTFAPVAGAFLADEPNSSPLNAFKNIKPLGSIDRGYHIYTNKKSTTNNAFSGSAIK